MRHKMLIRNEVGRGAESLSNDITYTGEIEPSIVCRFASDSTSSSAYSTAPIGYVSKVSFKKKLKLMSRNILCN